MFSFAFVFASIFVFVFVSVPHLVRMVPFSGSMSMYLNASHPVLSHPTWSCQVRNFIWCLIYLTNLLDGCPSQGKYVKYKILCVIFDLPAWWLSLLGLALDWYRPFYLSLLRSAISFQCFKSCRLFVSSLKHYEYNEINEWIIAGA